MLPSYPTKVEIVSTNSFTVVSTPVPKLKGPDSLQSTESIIAFTASST